MENSRKIFHFVSCSNLSLDRSILQRQIDIHRRIEDHRFTVGRSRASRKKRRKGVERRWPTGAALLIPRAHGAHHGRARMQRDAHRQVGKKETHAIPFHSRPRALYSTLASKLSPQRRGYISLSLSLPTGKIRSVPFSVWNRGQGSGVAVPNAYARTPSSNQQAIRHFAAWNAFSFRKPARTGRPLALACTIHAIGRC